MILEKFIKPEKNIVKPIAGTKIVFIAYKFPLKLNYYLSWYPYPCILLHFKVMLKCFVLH